MQSDSIVIAFDVTEDFRTGIFDRCKDAIFHQFRLEPGKETLGLGVIVTIATSRHWLAEPADVKQPAIFNRRVLAALIGMNNRSFANQTTPSRLIEDINHELRCGLPILKAVEYTKKSRSLINNDKGKIKGT